MPLFLWTNGEKPDKERIVVQEPEHHTNLPFFINIYCARRRDRSDGLEISLTRRALRAISVKNPPTVCVRNQSTYIVS